MRILVIFFLSTRYPCVLKIWPKLLSTVGLILRKGRLATIRETFKRLLALGDLLK
ncbi:hypothetical protein VULLAG_LOCUS14247 [Vulpes lagopus]